MKLFSLFTKPSSEQQITASLKPYCKTAKKLAVLSEFARELNNSSKDSLVISTVIQSIVALAKVYPEIPDRSNHAFTANQLLPDMRQTLENITRPFFSQAVIKASLFQPLRSQLQKNMYLMHGDARIPVHKYRSPSIPASWNEEVSIEALYTQDTPFHAIIHKVIQAQVPPQRLLTEHGTIFAPTGHGKTQLLQHLISSMLLTYEPMSMWVIDNQGDMLDKLSRLNIFNPDDGVLKDRIVIIDPEQDAPALNLFDLGAQDAMTDDLFLYMFSAIDNSLTPQQSTTVTFLMRLMHSIPGATINTLRQALQDNSKTLSTFPFAEHVNKLDQLDRDWFEHVFFQGGPMQATKHSIARRLFALQANQTFNKMFAAPTNAFNASQAIEQKKVVLINTSQKLLGDGSAVLGRFFIAQALSAAYRRPPLSNPALLVLDEAQIYLDYQSERILSTARKYGLGLMAASQFLEKIPRDVQAAIHGNTAIKIAGPVSFQDANALAREMYTDGDFIRSVKKTDREAEFALYIRSVTPKAVKSTFPFFTVENMPKMTEDQYVRMRKANRERYGTTQETPPPIAPVPIPNTEHTPQTDKQWI